MTDLINWTIFNELLIMDEDEQGFSKSLIQTFIEQATQTFTQIEEILLSEQQDAESLNKLSQLGHYLKGSAASLGLVKIQEQCERIQNYGLLKNFDGAVPDDGRDFWGGVKLALSSARVEFESARKFLSDYYKEAL